MATDLHVVLPANGAIWFGGQNGVSRFDGTWTTYPLTDQAKTARADAAEDPASLVTAMAVDSDQNLLIGTQTGWVYRLDEGVWEQLFAVGAPIHALQVVDDAIWVGAQDGLTLIRGGRQTPVAPLQGNAIFAIQPGTSTVWIGADRGLWQVTTDGATALPYITEGSEALPAGAATAIALDKDGALWVGIASTLVKVDPETGQFDTYLPFGSAESAPKAVRITSIGVDDGATVWVASENNGVVAYDFENGKQTAAENYGSRASSGLESEVVRDLSIGDEGSVWFATPVGAFRFYSLTWAAIDDLSGLPVSDLAVDATDNLWIATKGEGIIRIDGARGTRTEYYPGPWDLAHATVPKIEAAADGRIWAATLNGVSLFAAGKWQNPVDPAALPSPAVNAIAVDDSALWIGTDKGLARYNFVERTIAVEPAFANRALQDLQIDGAGRLWALTAAGTLYVRLGNGEWQAARATMRGLPDGAKIMAIAAPAAPQDIAFAAVDDSGVFRWNGSQWTEYGPHSEWLDGHILALTVDANGRSLWIGTNIGVGRLDEVGLTLYDARDGAAGGEIRSIESAGLGGYWVGGQKGLWRFKSEPSAPVLTSNDFVGGIEQRDHTWQAYTDRQLSLYFETGDLHTTSDRIQVSYRMSGNDQIGEWQTAHGRSIPLVFATPGIYAVELVARDLSFNYSTPVIRTVTAVAAPLTVTVPLLGDVEARIFSLMLIFAATAFVGLGYVAYESIGVRRRTSTAIRRGFNPYISGEPVRRANMFFGRQDLVARISATLHNNSIMIHGERRIGKTTLLYQLASVLRKVQDKAYWFLPVFIDMEGTSETELFHLLMEDILGVVSELPELSAADRKHVGALQYWTQHNGAYDDRIFGRDLRTLMTILEEYAQVHQQGRQVRLILLMDEMDTLSRFDRVYQQQLRRIFMRDFAATLGAVVAGIELSKDWDRVESPWFNLFNEIEIQPLPRAAARELMVKPVQHFYRYDEDALQFILAHSEGRPFRLQQYGMESVNHMLRERRRRITMADVQYAHNLVQSEQNIQAAQAGLTKQVISGESSRSAPALFNPT